MSRGGSACPTTLIFNNSKRESSMAYKSKKQKEAEAAIAAAAETKITADIFQSEVFKSEMERYRKSASNIPMLLKAILEERVATRLILEGKV